MADKKEREIQHQGIGDRSRGPHHPDLRICAHFLNRARGLQGDAATPYSKA